MKRIAKQDLRRHFSKMLLRAINTNSGGTIGNFFSAFMKRDCKFHLEYSLGSEEPAVAIAAEGPQMTSFYILGLGVMFPDMILLQNSCELYTSNLWNGTKLVIQGTFHSSPMYRISLQRAVTQMHAIYARHTFHGNSVASSRSFDGSDSGTRSPGSSTSDTESQSHNGSGKSWKTEEDSDYGQDSPLIIQVREMFDQIPLLKASRNISLSCTITVILDHHNKMEQVYVSVNH